MSKAQSACEQIPLQLSLLHKESQASLDSAVEYVNRGWAVFPLHSVKDGVCTCGEAICSIGKHPRIDHGFKDATTDEPKVNEWWSKWPDANIGIATGSRSGIVVLDVDVAKGTKPSGEATLDELRSTHGALPATITSLTGGGGKHFFFRYQKAVMNSRVGFLPGLDIRGDGGYVVAPPSLHKSGRRYEWMEGHDPDSIDLAEMPPWLIDILINTKKEVPITVNAEREVPPVPQTEDDLIPAGERNSTLTSLAGKMRQGGMTESEINAALKTMNQARCKPPLPHIEVEKIARSISRYEPQAVPSPSPPNNVDRIMDIAGDIDLFHSPDRKGYGAIEQSGKREIWPVESDWFRTFILAQYYQAFSKVPSSQSVKDAIGALNAKAIIEGEERKVDLRLAEADGSICLDLCDGDRRIVRIDPFGWSIDNSAPVYFERSKGMQALPVPIRGGSLNLLKQFINIDHEDQFILIVSWLLAALRPKGPYPILILHGEQGSAKSTTARLIRSLVDPSISPLRTMSAGDRDLMIGAKNQWILAFDNLSGLKFSVSDALCRLSTGGGFSTRELYKNAEEVIFDAQRPIILNGIDDLTTRGDLVDRAIFINLPRIPEDKRQLEAELWGNFDAAQPYILASLLDAVSTGLSNVNSVKLKSHPRMADFAHWIVACEPALPWGEGRFLEAYEANREAATNALVENDIVASAVIEFMQSRSSWEGAAKELLALLERCAGEDEIKGNRQWPKYTKLTSSLRRLAPSLRKLGIDFFYDEKARPQRKIILTKLKQ